MTHVNRLRLAVLIAVSVFVVLASMRPLTSDGDVYVPSRIWLGPTAEASP